MTPPENPTPNRENTPEEFDEATSSGKRQGKTSSPNPDFQKKRSTEANMAAPAPQKKVAAWLVHLFTATGILAALLALIAVHESDWREVFLWLFVALFIDGVDGSLARLARVEEVLPQMSGKMIDAVIDFTTYATIPAFFFYQAELAPEGWNLICAGIMVVSSALYYGKEGMIADTMHFIGFPALWNVFVFYMFFVYTPPGWVNVALVVLFALLHFAPVKFAYPSRSTRWRLLTLFVSLAGMLAAALIIWMYPVQYLWMQIVVAVAGSYFVLLAFMETYFVKE